MTAIRNWTVLALAAAVCQPAMAAHDPGPHHARAQWQVQRVGVGGQASLTVPLGGSHRRDDSRRPALALNAGPSITRANSSRTIHMQTRVAPMAQLAFGPGEPVVLSLAGQPVSGLPQGERRNVSSLGWVGIGVGIAAVVGGVLLLDRIRDASD